MTRNFDAFDAYGIETFFEGTLDGAKGRKAPPKAQEFNKAIENQVRQSRPSDWASTPRAPERRIYCSFIKNWSKRDEG